MAAADSTAASKSTCRYPRIRTGSTATRRASMTRDINASTRLEFVSDHSDHAFARVKVPLFSSQARKKIMQEWKLLREGLPESFTVRAYEERIDLLRAVIVGVEGTPYHDGLYFFDFAFPADYPRHPPSVHYRSYGYLINPNLYRSGKVCLSLLNTWSGSKSEKWNPDESTVLQVLLSLQALVLNERPFYNEPDVARSEKSSLSYNEEVFLLSCKTMMRVMRKPPMGFERFVAIHFRERARTILGACEAYVNGQAQVGHFKSDGNGGGGSSSSLRLAAVGSKWFRESLRTRYPELVMEFRRKGVSLHGIKEDLEVQNLCQALTKWKSDLAAVIISTLALFMFILLVPYLSKFLI